MKTTIAQCCLAAWLLTSGAVGALRQANTWTVSTANLLGSMNWNAKGDIFVAFKVAGSLSFSIQRAGKTSPDVYPVPDAAAATVRSILISDDLKYVVVDTCGVGTLHTCYGYKIGKTLTRVQQYTWDEALSGGRILQWWYDRFFFVIQQVNADGTVQIRVFDRKLKLAGEYTAPTRAGAMITPVADVSSHGRYVMLERSFDTNTGIRQLDFMRVGATLDLVQSKQTLGGVAWYGRDDSIVSCWLKVGGADWAEADRLEPWGLIWQYPRANYYEDAWVSAKKPGWVAAMNISNKLLVRNEAMLIGPQTISEVPAGAQATCVYFDGKQIVLCFHQLSGAYEMHSYQVTRTGFVHQRGPVTGSSYSYAARDDAFVVTIEGNSLLRLFSRNLKELGSATVSSSCTIRGRTCMSTSNGAGTLTYTVQRW